MILMSTPQTFPKCSLAQIERKKALHLDNYVLNVENDGMVSNITVW